MPVDPSATPPPDPPPGPPLIFVPSEIPAPVFQSQPEPAEALEEDETVPAPAFGRSITEIPLATPEPSPTPAPVRSSRSSSPRPSVNEAMTGERLAQLMSQARSTQSAKVATQVGWAHFSRKDYASAAMWFEQAIAWDSKLGEAYYGLALTKFTQGDVSQAEAIAGYRLNAFPKMKGLMGDILVQRAMNNYESRKYQRVVEDLDQASEYRSLTRSEQIIRGWSLYYTKDFFGAASIFEQLYRAQPDQQSAEGLYAALARLKDWERMEMIAAEVPGPLEEIYMTYDTENYYKSGLFLAAYTSNPGAYPALENFTSPSFTLGFEYAQKSGTAGESKLTTTRAPVVEFELYPADNVRFTAKVARLTLRSGDAPDEGALIGTPPDGEEYQAEVDAAIANDEPIPPNPFIYTNDPTTSFNDLYEVNFRLEYEDWLTPYIELGSTPLNAELSARLIGRGGVQYRHSQGYVQAEVYSQPIRESILSYVGMQDPYSSRAWGRVQETGGSVSVFQGFMEDYTFFAKASYGVITGTNTYQNDHLALVASISKLIEYEGFEYITIGPSFSYERFKNNQNFFTYGNGGYFSPEYIVQGLIEAQFLTLEGEQWIAAGAVGAGAQQNFQASAPYFPLDPDGRDYPSTSSSTGIFLGRIEGGILLTPQIMIGSKLSYAITADYNEGFASIYATFFFEPRVGLFRSDIDFSYW